MFFVDIAIAHRAWYETWYVILLPVAVKRDSTVPKVDRMKSSTRTPSTSTSLLFSQLIYTSTCTGRCGTDATEVSSVGKGSTHHKL